MRKYRSGVAKPSTAWSRTRGMVRAGDPACQRIGAGDHADRSTAGAHPAGRSPPPESPQIFRAIQLLDRWYRWRLTIANSGGQVPARSWGRFPATKRTSRFSSDACWRRGTDGYFWRRGTDEVGSKSLLRPSPRTLSISERSRSY